MSRSTSIIVFLVSVALFFGVVAFTYRGVDLDQLQSTFSILGLTKVLGLGLLFHLSFGLIMWVGFWLHYDLKIKPIEILTLPLMMHLFLYLMPMKGGMLFQVFYSKHKYALDLSKGFSLGMTVFFSSLILTIILGLFLVYAIPIRSFELTATLLFMAFAFIGASGILSLLPTFQPTSTGVVSRVVGFLIRVKSELLEQFKNPQLFVALIATTFASVVIQAILFWQTSLEMGIASDFLPVLLVVLILRVILLVRLLPGNLGIQEIMITVTFAAAGFSVEDGLLIGIVTRLISVFWSAVVGLPALYSNLKYFDVNNDGLIELIKNVAKPRK